MEVYFKFAWLRYNSRKCIFFFCHCRFSVVHGIPIICGFRGGSKTTNKVFNEIHIVNLLDTVNCQKPQNYIVVSVNFHLFKHANIGRPMKMNESTVVSFQSFGNTPALYMCIYMLNVKA